MTKRGSLPTALAVALLLVLALIGGASQVPPPPYRTAGNQILGPNGRPYLIHGLNRPSLEWQPQGDHLSQAEMHALAGSVRATSTNLQRKSSKLPQSACRTGAGRKPPDARSSGAQRGCLPHGSSSERGVFQRDVRLTGGSFALEPSRTRAFQASRPALRSPTDVLIDTVEKASATRAVAVLAPRESLAHPQDGQVLSHTIAQFEKFGSARPRPRACGRQRNGRPGDACDHPTPGHQFENGPAVECSLHSPRPALRRVHFSSLD